jgi:hypothetical protein
MSDNILRALVIDPDPRVLADAVRVLTLKGFHVAGRLTPDDSLDYIRRARPHVALLGRTFWEEGWGVEILAASPETVILPVRKYADVPELFDAAPAA